MAGAVFHVPALNEEKAVQTEVPEKFQVPRAGVQDMEKSIARVFQLKAQSKKDSQEGAVKIGTGVEINDEAIGAILKQLAIKGLKASRILERTPAHYLDKAQVAVPGNQDFRYIHHKVTI
jgi:hypothetical protein